MPDITKMELGDRMKLYEKVEVGRRFIPNLPVMVRIDGKNFSKKKLEKPFDSLFSLAMELTTMRLVKETNAIYAYTSSDEISLVLPGDNRLFFEGKISKIISVTASMATAYFNSYKSDDLFSPSIFDSRAWTMPPNEVPNCILWRELDAVRNSISMAARAQFSHKQCNNLNSGQLQEMLFQEASINWNDYKDRYKRGIHIAPRKIIKDLSDEELSRIPEEHRPDDGKAERKVVRNLNMPPFNKIRNRMGVIFCGDPPMIKGKNDGEDT